MTPAEIIAAHHDAFLAELLGTHGAGLTPERVDDLIAGGFLSPEAVNGPIAPLPGGRDPFEFARLVAAVIGGAPAEGAHELREWSLDDWRGIEPRPRPQPEGRPVAVQAPPAEVAQPAPPAPREPPGWMSPVGRKGWEVATERAGSFVRGLGNQIAEDVEAATTAERWDGEEIVGEVLPDRRAERVKVIREKVAEAIGQGRGAEWLASELGHATSEWARDWRRIAETELQGAYNAGRLEEAVALNGPGGRVARVPNTTACSACRALYIHPDGEQLNTFAAEDIAANGTNVGRKRGDWQPTVWPTHPRCLCDLIGVPEGMYATVDGRLRRVRKGVHT